MYCVYIIFSKKIKRFYTGTTDNVVLRLEQHNNGIYSDAYTLKGNPWELKLVIERLSSKQAFAIESHIKKMKSSKYILNLIRYPEMQEKLRVLYKDKV